MTQNEIRKLYALLISKIKKHLLIFDKSKDTKLKGMYKLVRKIENEINKSYDKMTPSLFKRFKQIANQKYLRTLYNSEKKGKINISKSLINKVDEIVNKIINRKVAGKTLIQRLTRNRNNILIEAKRIVKQSVKKGESIDKIAKKLRNRLNVDKDRSLLIARTEAHRIQEEATNKGYQGARIAGINFRVRWVSTLDMRTRDTHQKLDGKYADNEGYFYSSGGKTKYPGGFGIAKEDIRCRCTTIQVFEEIQGTDTRYEQTTGKYINYKTYEEWRNK